jgi:hypothetical protein
VDVDHAITVPEKLLCPSSGQKSKMVGKNGSVIFRRAGEKCGFPVSGTVLPHLAYPSLQNRMQQVP